MGTIHLAVAGGLADFRKLLVVKELRRDLSANERFVEMFLDEARLAGRLNHPNVVQTVEADREGDRYFLSMEFLDGQPFSAIWQEDGTETPFTLAVRLRILCDALAGLHYAHRLTDFDGTALDIVHRDVSPQNIFVTYDGQVKVVDFGIAKAAVSSQLTTPGVFKGKLGYAAPEQIRGEAVDARTDVFAVGVILWETLTGQRFANNNPDRAGIMARLQGLEPRAASFLSRIDPCVAAICDRALQVDPANRYPSAEALRSALEDYLRASGQPADSHAVAQAMGKRFEKERRAIHAMIDRHLKTGAIDDAVDGVRALGTDPGNNEPTVVTDLSGYASDANATVVSDVVPRLAGLPERRARPRWMVAAAAAAGAIIVVALALIFTTGSSDEAPTAPNTSLATAAPAAAPTAPQGDLAQTGTKRATPSANTEQPAKGELGDAVAAPPETPPSKPRVTARPARTTRPARRAPARRDRHRTNAPSETPAAPPATVVAAEAEHPATPAPAVEPAPKAPTDISVGADLNQVRRTRRRQLDTTF